MLDLENIIPIIKMLRAYLRSCFSELAKKLVTAKLTTRRDVIFLNLLNHWSHVNGN